MTGKSQDRQRYYTLGVALTATILLTQSPYRSPQPLVVWNASASIPIGLYWVEKRLPNINEIAVLKPPLWAQTIAENREYLPSTSWLLKPVVATQNGVVCRFGRRIYVDGKPVARSLVTDRNGRPMPVWMGCKVLKNDQLFLLSKRRDSFDSRYFGAVETALVIGTAKPLFIFGK